MGHHLWCDFGHTKTGNMFVVVVALVRTGHFGA